MGICDHDQAAFSNSADFVGTLICFNWPPLGLAVGGLGAHRAMAEQLHGASN
jgi:hypothetical protein